MSKPDIFQYTSYRQYIADWLDRPGGGSMADLATAAGCAPSLISAMLNTRAPADRRRRLTEQRRPAFCRALGLERDEADFLRQLMAFEDAPDEASHARAWAEIQATLQLRDATPLEGRAFQFFQDGHNLAIFELLRCAGARPEPGWIGRRLRPRMPEGEVRGALRRLVGLGLLRYGREGELRPQETVVIDSQHQDLEVRRATLHSLHRWALDRAAEALDRFGPQERCLRTVTLALPEERLPELVARIEQLEREVVQHSQAAQPNRVYQLSVQLVPLSQRTDT
ncbi:MAG: TIGR02147 family protein [Alphaproteobacteria bacterium]|nr:TIGR02147 family protein [Alphaproteobacteria bacterium]